MKQRLKQHQQLLENILSLSVLQVLNIVLPLITLPYLMTVVGKGNYGAYAVAFSMVNYITLVSAYGFGFSATKQISQHRDDIRTVSKIFSSVLVAKMFLAIISALPFLVISFFAFGAKYSLMVALGLGIVLGELLNPVWLFQGMENMKFMTLVNFICKLVSVLLIFTIIRTPDQYIYIILMDSIGYLCAGILSVILALKIFKVRFTRPAVNDVIFQLKDGWFIFWSTIFMTLYRSSNVFILKFFVSDAAIGIYAGAEKVIKAGQVIASPISTALFPNLSARFNNNTLKDNKKTLLRTSIIMGCLVFLIAIAVFVASPLINKLLLGGQDDGTISLIRIMVPVIFFGCINYILGIVGLINLGQQKQFFKAVMISGVLSIAFLLVTVSYYGNVSAALSMDLAEVVLFFICIYYISRLK